MKHSHLLLALPVLLVLTAALHSAESGKQAAKALATGAAAIGPVEDAPGLPRVLLIGDSISIGYTLPTRALLQGKANVHRPAANCSSTGYGLENLNRWLGDKKWDVIHFNFGLHDLKLPPEGIRHSEPDVYEKNLRELVKRLKATGAKLIWATTTPVPNGGNLAPDRRFGSVERYNAIARKVMEESGVAINDLNAAATPRMNELLIHRKDAEGKVHWDVHYVDEGYAILAKHVAASIVQALTKGPDPNPKHFIASPADLKARYAAQLHITKPDFVVFVPEDIDGVSDTGNEHFLVFDGPDGSLMAVWTQSSVENFSADAPPDQHIVFSRSTDAGKTWSKPRILAGPKRAGDGHMASWAYPLVSRKRRIYILYSQSIGKFDSFIHHTGWLHGIYSDDNGATWSKPQNVPVARSINDNPDPTMPPNMLCWQKPLRLGKDGRYFAGFTRWTSFDVRKPAPNNLGTADSRVEFMRFENVDDNPEPCDLKIAWFMSNEKALAVPVPKVPENSVCQEPSLVKLPDGRLFCVMRTAAGSPFWSVSADGGETWTSPRRLLRKDGGEPLLHPVSPCPIYDVGGNEAGSGRYVLFIHNNDGAFKGYRPKPTVTGFNRRPIYLAPGRYQPVADQPVWFDDLKFFMDHDNVSLGKPGTNGRMDLSLYASFTVRHGQAVLWYPDRKFFLLGRVIREEWFGPAPSLQPVQNK